MIVDFRKRLSENILQEVNALIIERARKRTQKRMNMMLLTEMVAIRRGGTLIVDVTCAPEDMRFPHEEALLDEARRKTERIIDRLYEGAPEGYAKPRTYRKVARKEFLRFIRNQKPREWTMWNALKKQLQYVERNLRIICIPNLLALQF
jgi:hypothetical protein